MHIASILTAERTLNHAQCGSKKKALETLAELIAKSSDDIDAEELFHQLIARERLGSTGLGQGIAIPHCRFKTQGRTIGALMTMKQAIDYDSVDGKPVDLIFAMLVPEDAESEHLQTLATLAEAMQKTDFVDALRDTSSNEQLYKLAVTI